jgi:hypothetical protein
MTPWCNMSARLAVDEGKFYVSILETQSGGPLHAEDDFLDHLAELIMQRYEGKPGAKVVELPVPGTDNPLRTRRHYRRLFFNDNDVIRVTQDFVTWASETLGLWIELSQEDTMYSEGGHPHSADPVYDLLSIIEDENRSPRLRVVQVKATENNLQGLANKAINNFERLENGDFDAELSTRLELIERRRDAPTGIRFADLLFDIEKRYRVTAVHDQDHTVVTILTTYDMKVPGSPERRSAYLIRAQSPGFWDELGRRIYEQLAG